MKIYDKIQTFTTDVFQKQQLDLLRKNKVNVSKFIRDAINEKLAKESILKKDKRNRVGGWEGCSSSFPCLLLLIEAFSKNFKKERIKK